jgi:hypothetical protein
MAARAHASISLSVIGLPASYSPGSPLTFEVGLSGAADLNSYTVGLDLNSDKGKAGTDFYFVGSPTTVQSPASSYVFSSSLSVTNNGFVATADEISSTNTALLTLSDFLNRSGSVADASPYTMLATVTIETTRAAGDLSLSFDGTVLELQQPGGQDVVGFDTLEENLASFNPPVVLTPEPTSLTVFGTLLLLAAVVVGWRPRRR